jgi:hypothetical protein
MGKNEQMLIFNCTFDQFVKMYARRSDFSPGSNTTRYSPSLSRKRSVYYLNKTQKERSWQWAESNRRRVGVAGI